MGEHNPIENNPEPETLPRAIPAWPVHSFCDCCHRALSRTQVYCSCGWEQRPIVIHIIDSSDRCLCGHAPNYPPIDWGPTDGAWVPIDRWDADPLPSCVKCIRAVFELGARVNGAGDAFEGDELVECLQAAGYR